MPVIVYRGTAVDVSQEPKVFVIDRQTGQKVTNRPPKSIEVTRKPIEVFNLWGIMCPVGVSIEVENDVAHKARCLGHFDVYGDTKPPEKKKPGKLEETKPLEAAPPAIKPPQPELAPDAEVIEVVKKRGPGRPRKNAEA